MSHTYKIILSSLLAVFLAFLLVWVLVSFVPIKESITNPENQWNTQTNQSNYDNYNN